jgi:steroid delta-isomerase-like uncharacterized protein
MSVAENKNLIQHFFLTINPEYYKARTPGKEDSLHSPEVVIHTAAGDGNLKQFEEVMINESMAFPDLKYTVIDMIGEDDKVAARYRFTGTNTGSFMNLPASGKSVSVEGIGIFRIAQGRIAEAWFASDELGFMKQIGAIPS